MRARRLRTRVQRGATNTARGESCANDADLSTQQRDSDSNGGFDSAHSSMRRRVRTALVHIWDTPDRDADGWSCAGVHVRISAIAVTSMCVLARRSTTRLSVATALCRCVWPA